MRKRTIALIVLVALLSIGGIGFLVYKNWAVIVDIVTFKSKRPAEIKIPDVKPLPVVPKDVNTILDVEPDKAMQEELNKIQQKGEVLTQNANNTFETAIQTIQKESSVRKDKSEPMSKIVVENTKQRQTKAQKAASDRYRNILKQIEIEKAKAAVVLTGARTEKERKTKLDTLNVEALDMEMELFVENNIKRPVIRKPMSKLDAEYLVYKGLV